MRITEGFIIRDIAGETVAIPSGAAAHKLSGLVALNQSGKFLFELLQTDQTTESLTKAMLSEYEIDESTARADVIEFLDIFRQSGILIED